MSLFFASSAISSSVLSRSFTMDFTFLNSKTISSVSSSSGLSTSTVSITSRDLGESGGGTKRFQLLSVESTTAVCLCLGFVGQKKRFCIKEVSSPGDSCDIKGHVLSKYKLTNNSLYIRATPITAFCSPVFPSALLPEGERGDTILASMRTTSEWTTLFETLERDIRAIKPDSILPPKVKLDFNPSLLLKTPAKPSTDRVTDRVWEDNLTPFIEPLKLPKMDSEDETSFWSRAQSDWRGAGIPDSLSQLLKRFHESFDSIATTWPVPFQDIERHFELLDSDMSAIQTAIENLRKSIGKEVSVLGITNPDLWCAIDTLASSVGDLLEPTFREGLLTSMKTLASLETHQASLGTSIESLRSKCEAYDGHFEAIGPFLLEVRRFLDSNASGAPGVPPVVSPVANLPRLESVFKSEVDQQRAIIESLTERILRLESASSSAPAPTPTAWSSGLVAGSTVSALMMDQGVIVDRIVQMEHKLQTLERRLVGDGVSVGIYAFQSFEDCRVWMKTHVPNHRYGLFVDVISLFELFCMDHITTSETIGSFYNSKKTGFATMYEASHAASMTNMLPTILGKGSKDGMDSSRFLPGLQHPDKWSYGGTSGLRFQIERELQNVDTQLSAEILSALSSSSEASGLARECLFRAKRFIIDLSSFITQDYEFWRSRGYPMLDAWALVCNSLRRIFEDIHAVRVYGRNVKTDDDQLTASKLVWATLQAHVVMTDYTKRSIYEHPSVSAVVARHLASNHKRPGEDDTSARYTKLEKGLAETKSKLDAFESRVNNKFLSLQGAGGEGGGGGRGRNKKGANDGDK